MAARIDQDRPSPDALLEQANREGRGKLRIFLGAAPGVGKTFEMLTQGRRRRLDGADVVIGVVETHGRLETEALTKGFDIVPKKRSLYKGRVVSEMDLDAILQRKPQLVLVDELAHTNVEGSRHPKRYLDVEELLAAGIDVFTTINIQHIDSLNDVIAQITRIRVRETVPDAVLDEADEIELVDLTAEDLLARLREGKVYIKAQAERALNHFFSPGNLTALRELALRKVAQHVDRDMVDYMQAHAIGGPWPAGERILVCVSERASAAELVRYARRVAAALKAEWTALHIESARHVTLSEVDKDRIADTLRLAQRLGGQAASLPGRDIAESILNYAHRNNITQIIIAKSERPFWFELIAWFGCARSCPQQRCDQRHDGFATWRSHACQECQDRAAAGGDRLARLPGQRRRGRRYCRCRVAHECAIRAVARQRGHDLPGAGPGQCGVFRALAGLCHRAFERDGV